MSPPRPHHLTVSRVLSQRQVVHVPYDNASSINARWAYQRKDPVGCKVFPYGRATVSTVRMEFIAFPAEKISDHSDFYFWLGQSHTGMLLE
jgi:hypothetical protein